MTQGVAILLDSVRELRSHSLFWISLSISAIVAIALFGMISFNEDGWRILWFSNNESELIYEGSPAARALMTWMFSAFVFWWLSWGAIILAILSTSSILPGFLASGSIEITLAKPISRVRLFVWKVTGAWMFVLIQTAIAVLLAYFLLGAKMDIWIPAMLWSIPLIVVQFIYLYCVSTLVAVVTRSALASLMVTIIFWGVLSLVQFASNQMDKAIAQSQYMTEQCEQKIAVINQAAENEGRELSNQETYRVDAIKREMEPFKTQLDMMEPYQRPLNIVELVAPKTADMQKIIADLTEAPTFSELLMGFGAMDSSAVRPAQFDEEEWQSMQEAGVAGEKAVREVNIVKSLGSSLIFSLVVFLGACWLFTRKSY